MILDNALGYFCTTINCVDYIHKNRANVYEKTSL